MNILILLIFISLILVGGAVLFFGFAVENQDFDTADQLSFKPLEDDTDDAANSDKL